MKSHNLLWIAFSLSKYFKTHLLYRYRIPFYCWTVFHCMDVPHFIYRSVDGHGVVSTLGVLGHVALKNPRVSFCVDVFSFLVGRHLGAEVPRLYPQKRWESGEERGMGWGGGGLSAGRAGKASVRRRESASALQEKLWGRNIPGRVNMAPGHDLAPWSTEGWGKSNQGMGSGNEAGEVTRHLSFRFNFSFWHHFNLTEKVPCTRHFPCIPDFPIHPNIFHICFFILSVC